MHRRKVYPGQEVLDEDILTTNRFALAAVARLTAAALGVDAVARGLAVTPGAGLSVTVGVGELYALGDLDSTAYGTLASDATQVMRQGVLEAAANLPLAAPGVAGQARFYLIQARAVYVDRDQTVLPYFDVANPDVPWSGPNNDGTTDTTTRACICEVQAKAGVAAALGSQTIPAADAGWVGLQTVLIRNGQAAVAAADILELPLSPYLHYPLRKQGMPAHSYAFARGQIL